MTGRITPFPKMWGSSRSFPQNMRPYYGTMDASTPDALRVTPATADMANVVLLRHAHSRAQAAVSLQKKIFKFKGSDRSAVAAAALDRKIRAFKLKEVV